MSINQASPLSWLNRILGFGTCAALGLAGIFILAIRTVDVAAQSQPVAAPTITAAGPVAGNADSGAPVLSQDGHLAIFISSANNLVTNDHNGLMIDVFVRDLTNRTTTLMSVNTNGVSGNGHSSYPILSTNNQYLAFESQASDLVAGDTNGASDIFVRDWVNGKTLLASVNTNGTGSGNGRSYNPSLTPDGRYVVFESYASDLVANDTNEVSDVFIRDMVAGTTTLVSVNDSGTASALNKTPRLEAATAPAISDDGRYVVFQSCATNLTANLVSTNPPGQNVTNIYMRDMQAGITALLSFGANQARAVNTNSSGAVISRNGAWVAFGIAAPDLVNPVSGRPTNGLCLVELSTGKRQMWCPLGGRFSLTDRYLFYETNELSNSQIYRLDLSANTSQRVSVTPWETNGLKPSCTAPISSLDGRLLAFRCADTNNNQTTFVRDLDTGETWDTGVPEIIALRDDGRAVTFLMAGPAVAAVGRQTTQQAYVRDVVTGHTELISQADPTATGYVTDWSQIGPQSLSSDGRYLTFVSSADNLVTNDHNGLPDVFVRDMWTGSNWLVSASVDGMTSGNQRSYDPVISADGSVVSFISRADNLTPDGYKLHTGTNDAEGLFVRDWRSGTNCLVTFAFFGGAFDNRVFSAHGSVLAYNTIWHAFVTEWAKGSNTVWGSLPATFDPSEALVLSADGRWLGFQSSSKNLVTNAINYSITNLYVRDLWSGSNSLVSVARTDYLTSNGNSYNAVMTSDGRYVFFQSEATYLTSHPRGRVGSSISKVINVFVRDLQSQTTELVSVTTNGTLSFKCTLGPAGVNADGRFVVFTSYDDDLVVGDTNLHVDVFVRDRQARTTKLVSINQAGTLGGNGDSQSPVISADGRWVAFTSRASDLTPNDTNGFSDVFLRDLQTGVTTLLSANRTGAASADQVSSRPLLSADGSTVVFSSFSTDLPLDYVNLSPNAFYYRAAPTSFIDTDSDGMDDAWEMAHFGNLTRDGKGYADQDGQSDLNEFLAGTDPKDPASFFHGEVLKPLPNGDLPLTWTALPGRTYRVKFKNNLNDMMWQDLPANISITGATATAVDHSVGGSDQRYYRVLLLP